MQWYRVFIMPTKVMGFLLDAAGLGVVLFFLALLGSNLESAARIAAYLVLILVGAGLIFVWGRYTRIIARRTSGSASDQMARPLAAPQS